MCLVLRGHLLAGLELVKVELAGGHIVVGGGEALSEVLGLNRALSRLLLMESRLLLLLGRWRSFLHVTAATSAKERIRDAVADDAAHTNTSSSAHHIAQETT